MEQVYWLERANAARNAAETAAGSQARLVHYDMAGRYGVKAAMTAPSAIGETGDE